MEPSSSLLLNSLIYFLRGYFLLLLARILIYWFPNVSSYEQPWSGLLRVTDPFLKIFRGLVPLFMGVDISPLLGFLCIQYFIEVLPITFKFLKSIL